MLVRRLWKAVPPGLKWQVHRVLGRLPEVRIFQIGFNKAGTTTLHQFLIACGISSVHFDGGDLALKITERINAAQEPLIDYPTCVAFTDMEFIGSDRIVEPYRMFELLHSRYPNALFILNVRNEERWLRSRLNHIPKAQPRVPLIDRYTAYYDCSEDEVVELWRADRRLHHARVRRYFAGNPNFLEIDIEQDVENRLRQFLLPYFPDAAHASWGCHNTAQSRA